MCGIAGIIHRYGSQPTAEALACAAGQMHHRGPDDSGVEIAENVGLAHTRLSIIGLDSGHQPLVSADGRQRLVVNGEIYNYIELTADLREQGAAFATASDSETLLHGYRLKGIDYVNELHGMYAFALHDSNRKSLFLGRDRMGIKPLFYAVEQDRIAFASELKALLPLLSKQPSINPAAFGEFLHNQFNSGRDTIFNGVKRVLPGEVIRIDGDLHLYHQQYWSATDIVPRQLTLQQAEAEFEPLFEQVMREHMRTDVPFGLFLSGGIDSSVLLSVLSRLHPHPLQTFSVGFKDSAMDDELSAAEALAQHFGTEHTSLQISRDDLFARLVEMIWAADDLMRDYAALPTAMLAETAAKSVKVVFSGEGGDEAFAGYRRYRPSFEQTMKAMVKGTGGFRTSSQLPQRDTTRLLNNATLKPGDARRPFRGAWEQAPKSWSHIQRCQYVDLTTALPDNLFVKADRMMMAHGLEGRVPFADHRMVEFGLALPDAVKLHQKKGKWLIRHWAAQHLPADHLAKPKRGFHVPVPEWMQGRFLDDLAQKLAHNHALQHWFNLGALPDLVARQKQTGKHHRTLFCLMQFAIWHRLMVDAPGTRPGTHENPLDWIN